MGNTAGDIATAMLPGGGAFLTGKEAKQQLIDNPAKKAADAAAAALEAQRVEQAKFEAEKKQKGIDDQKAIDSNNAMAQAQKLRKMSQRPGRSSTASGLGMVNPNTYAQAGKTLLGS